MAESGVTFVLGDVKGNIPPTRAFHVAVNVSGKIYVHGGIGAGNVVLHDLFCLDLQTLIWTEIRSGSSNFSHFEASHNSPAAKGNWNLGTVCSTPALSHHTGHTLEDRYLLLIGGWNGRKRTSDFYIFDTKSMMWYTVPISGTIPSGLSSHTSNILNDKKLLIIGREGGVHTQRRYGNAFVLDITNGRYSEFSNALSSRSGHTTVPLKKGTLDYFYVYGGRRFKPLGEWLRAPFELGRVSDTMTERTRLIEKVATMKRISKKCQEPEGRQHHTCSVLSDAVFLIYGGEMWKGARENVTSDMFLYDQGTWYSVSCRNRAPLLKGHSTTVVSDNDLIVFGGSDGKKTSNKLWIVQL